MSFSAGPSSLDAQAEALARRLLDAHPPTRAYTRADLEALPGPLARLLGARLDARVAEATAPDSPYVDAAAPSVRAAVEAWQDAARATARYPADTWEDALADATRDTLAAIVEPAVTLAALAFDGLDEGASQPADVAVARVRPAAPAATLPEVAARYVERKELATLDRAALERLLRRIDRRMAEGLGAADWAALAAPLFDLAGPAVEPSLVRAFLEAKGAGDLAAQVPDSSPSVTREAFQALVAASPDEAGPAVEATPSPVEPASYASPPAEPPPVAAPQPAWEEPAPARPPGRDVSVGDESPAEAMPAEAAPAEAMPVEETPVEETPVDAGWTADPVAAPRESFSPPPAPFDAWQAPEPPAAAPPPLASPPEADPDRLVPPLEPLPVGGRSLDPFDAPLPDAAPDVIAPPAHLPPPVPAAPEPAPDDEPLWKRMTRSHGMPPPLSSAAPAPPAAPTDGPALWQRFAADAPPASSLGASFASSAAPLSSPPVSDAPAPDLPPGAPSAEPLAALEARVLGADAAERREWYVRELFGGDAEAYAATLAALNVTRTWTEATQVIARDVLRKHRINIYSEPAVAFTDAVQAQMDPHGSGAR